MIRSRMDKKKKPSDEVVKFRKDVGKAEGTIASGMFWRFGEKITAQAVSFIVSVILARILMPEDYGVVALVNVFIAIAEIFVTSGLGTALIQKKEATELDFSTLFWCNLILSVVIYLIVFCTAPLIANFYGQTLLTPVLRILAVRIPINAVNSIQNAYVSRNMDFQKFFFATIIGTVVSAVVGIAMAYGGYGVFALVAQVLTNSLIDTICLFILIKWRPRLLFSIKSARPLMQYGWKILATDLIGTIFNQLNAFVIGKKYTSSDLAYYTQGKKIPDMISNNLGATLSAVLFPAMSLSNGTEDIKRIRRKSLKLLEYILFPLMLGLIAVADKLTIVLLTEKWISAVPYIRITSIAAVIGVLGTTLIQETKAIGRSDLTLKIELIKKPVMLAVLLVAMHFGVRAIAFTLIINEIIAFAFNVYPVRKYIGFDFAIHLGDAVEPFLMALVMSGVVYFVGVIISQSIVSLILQILTGIIIYVGLSVMLKNESFEYLKRIIDRKIHRDGMEGYTDAH